MDSKGRIGKSRFLISLCYTGIASLLIKGVGSRISLSWCLSQYIDAEAQHRDGGDPAHLRYTEQDLGHQIEIRTRVTDDDLLGKEGVLNQVYGSHQSTRQPP